MVEMWGFGKGHMVSDLGTRSSLERDAKEGESPVEEPREETALFQSIAHWILG